ncbi:hypothetical protein RvVAT039_pl03120 (plasmid) [Agrobacterium vitis]|nr:hypothetical protein RvVAT039_pl03120 [Agrobacterium vitis]
MGLDLIVHTNDDALATGLSPITHDSDVYTRLMKTEALKDALNKHGFDAAFGGARRDEEQSRAKERIFSFRTTSQSWDPKNQRPELWDLYNGRIAKGESVRVFPLSNWTEIDIWHYIMAEDIPVVSLYFADRRPVVRRGDLLIMVDDKRLPIETGQTVDEKLVRFRSLGCYPLTAAIESEARSCPDIIREIMVGRTSERSGRVMDLYEAGSMESKKREGYF